jgi:hypothetical protein
MSDKHGRIGCCEFVEEVQKAPSFFALCSPVSAYKLHCGNSTYYAEATANFLRGLDLSTYDEMTGKEDGLGCFIVTKRPELCPVIAACKDSAKMAMKALVESGDCSFEDLLLRKWKAGIQLMVGWTVAQIALHGK